VVFERGSFSDDDPDKAKYSCTVGLFCCGGGGKSRLLSSLWKVVDRLKEMDRGKYGNASFTVLSAEAQNVAHLNFGKDDDVVATVRREANLPDDSTSPLYNVLLGLDEANHLVHPEKFGVSLNALNSLQSDTFRVVCFLSGTDPKGVLVASGSLIIPRTLTLLTVEDAIEILKGVLSLARDWQPVRARLLLVGLYLCEQSQRGKVASTSNEVSCERHVDMNGIVCSG